MDSIALLDQDKLLDIFGRMNRFLAKREQPLTLVSIGSAFLIATGMPGRGTLDIDLWRTGEDNHALLVELAEACGLPLDPIEACDQPHLSWVSNDFVDLPDLKQWKNDTVAFWAGSHLTLTRPPIGIILGSKLVAFRAKDVADINWIVDSFPEWKDSLAMYRPMFTQESQAEIERNYIFVNYHLDVQKSTMSDPEHNADTILPRRTKR